MLTERYTALVQFLKSHERCWLPPILPNWPSSRAGFPEEWLSFIANLSFADQRCVADGESVAGMPHDLAEALGAASQLTLVKQARDEWPLDSADVQGLNLKKQHEITRILPFLAGATEAVTHAVDIGGGMGHLARLCVKYFEWDFHSIDRDPILQDKGRWWLKRSRDLPRDKLNFVLAEFSERPDPAVDALFAMQQSLSLGLHTCGGLALSQFQKSLGSEVIINFGCCFDKMDLFKDLNRSQLAQNLDLRWSQAALFLATRSRQGLLEAEFKLLKRVNDYRFALDLWFRRHHPELGFVIAGDAPKALYADTFAHYALNRFAKLGVEVLPLPAELEEFYAKDEIQTEIATIFAAHLIRDLFARPLELAILYDRALWLVEKDFAVELIEVFDRSLSPRNIAIVARKRK